MAWNDRKQPIVWGIGGVVLGLIAGAGGYALFGPHTVTYSSTALRLSDLNQNESTYRFIDPLLALKNQNNSTPQEFKSLESDLTNFIASQKAKGKVGAVSVYFREVGHQGGITLNPDEEYNPASLLKVPTMMAYYKIAETNPSILTDRLLYSGTTDENVQEHLKSRVQLTPGQTYSVEELIEHMIKYSDNNAATLLIDHLNATSHEDAFNTLFNDLGITELDLTDDFITTNAYILFFRVLYNSTYLSRDMSEKAMELLTQTDFKDGLVAGFGDQTIPAAHKFGEFTLTEKDGTVIKSELHDCGFIYYPGHTYSLCIMTKGDDFAALKNVISGISSRIYATIANQN
jgi:beta-lactamase class A